MIFRAIYNLHATKYLMLKNEDLVGSYMIDKYNYMYNFNIQEKFRGNKYSNNLVEHCILTNSNNFNNPLNLHVMNTNKKAIYLYEKHGFRVEESFFNKKINNILLKMTYSI